MALAIHDIERGAKVCEHLDEKGKPCAKRMGVISKVHFIAQDGKINPDATTGDVHSVEVDFGDGKPKTFRGTSQLALYQKASQAALDKLSEQSQTRVAIDGRDERIKDALGITNTPKIAPNDPDMGLRRK